MAPSPFLSDVTRQFRSLNANGQRIAIWAGFPSLFSDKRYSIFHKKGGLQNHFQGIRRLGKHLLVTGSFPYRQKRADLFVFELGSRTADPGPWGSNLVRQREPVDIDRLVAYFPIDQDYWHAGSFAVVANTMAVPLEGDGNDSVITFVDLTNPAVPVRVAGSDIVRQGAKAGVVTTTSLPGGHVLLAVWSDSDKAADGSARPYRLDLYLSGAPGSPTDFRLAAQFEPPDGSEFHCQFQGLDFVWERGAGGDQLFLVGFENTAGVQPLPTDPGLNRARLFGVNLPPSWLAAEFDPGTLAAPGILADFVSHVDTVHLAPAGDWYNMDAGASVYVDSNQQLIAYSVYHFLSPFRQKAAGDTLAFKCMEFRATDFLEAVDQIEDAWVDLYEEAQGTGRMLSLLGPWESSIENTSKCFSADRAFRAAGSACFQSPAERAYVLYPERDFKGQGPLILAGNGSVRRVDLSSPEPYPFRSGRFLPLSVAQALAGARLA